MVSTMDLHCHVRRDEQDLRVDDQAAKTVSHNKRLKIGNIDHEQFRPGSLVKMKLENFVTYTLTEFNLSPSLNMIIGPNGSGKSTFVCAVCLGLAGKPEYIGRSKKVSDYIKNGEDSGSVEITLKNSPIVKQIAAVEPGDEVIVIKRIMSRLKTKSEYFINGIGVSESTIKSLILQLNIQLDNLCQFLSQERVEEFARLKSDKLLVETIRSIDCDLIAVLNQSKQFQTLQLNTQKELENNNKRVDTLKEKRQKLDESVRAFKEYERKKREIEIHVQLLPYVKVKDHKVKSQAYKRDYEEAKANLKALLKEKKPFSIVQKEVEKNSDSLQDKIDKKIEDMNRGKEKYKQNVDQLELMRENIEKKRSQNKYYRDRTNILKSEILKTKTRLETAEKELSQMESPDSSRLDEISFQRKELIKRETDIRDLIMELDSKGTAISHEVGTLTRQIENRQRSLQGSDRISVLDQSRDLLEVKKAVLYIRSRPEMANKVLEPPIMSISVGNPKIAAYLAQCVDYNTCKAFTVTDSDAYEKYADEILQRFKVNLRELSNYDSNQPIQIPRLRELGFEDYLSNFVSGDRNVIQMLCQFSKIHTIPISRRELSPAQLSSLTSPDKNGRLLFKRMIHGNKVVDIKRSLYGRKQVFMVDSNVKDTNFYQASVISEEHLKRTNSDISQLQSRIENGKAKLDGLALEKNRYKQKVSNNQIEQNSLAKEAHSLNMVRQKYTMKKNEIIQLDADIKQLGSKLKKDVSHKIQAVEEEIAQLIATEMEGIQKVIELAEKLSHYQREHILSELRHFDSKNIDMSMRDVFSHYSQRENELTLEYNEKKRILKDTRKTAEYREWIRQINSYSDETKEELNEYAEEYEKSHNFNLQFIQSMVDRLESEIATENHDESAITILEEVERELKRLEDIIPTQLQELNEVKQEFHRHFVVLEPRLDDMTAKISARFSQLFNNVGSAGAIQLDKPHLISDWKLEIMVKFRDNAVLKKLDSHAQSGGERAVSTVLYMIALQEFANAPFRVVDEINQGMDSRNERIMHKCIVENACAENTSQYFLITPKLLTDLHYDENMRIHCVMAGPWIPDPVERPEMVNFGQTSRYVF